MKHIYPVCIPAPIAYIQLSETCQLDVQHAHVNHCYVEAFLTQGKVSVLTTISQQHSTTATTTTTNNNNNLYFYDKGTNNQNHHNKGEQPQKKTITKATATTTAQEKMKQNTIVYVFLGRQRCAHTPCSLPVVAILCLFPF